MPDSGEDSPSAGRGGWRRILTVAAAAMGVVVLVVVGTAAALLYYGDRSVTRIAIPQLDARSVDVDGDGQIDVEEISDTLNILAVGVDSRKGLSDEQLQALGTEDESGRLTDTIMLIQLNPETNKVAILSFPRDLLVERCDGSKGRINQAYEIGIETGVGGPHCLVETIQDFTGIPVNHYVAVDFAGFLEVVDTLDGVSLYLDQPLKDVYAGVDLPAGCVALSPQEALGFVRARHVDNDFGRIARQQRFLKELIEEVVSVDTVANLPRLFSLVGSIGGAVETDEGLSLGTMRRIAFSFRGLTPDRIVSRTVPVEDYIEPASGAYYLRAQQQRARELFAAFRRGSLTDAEEPAPKPPPAEVAVADVGPVSVLNATDVSGLASRASELLRQEGFIVAETGDADEALASTRVRYPPDRRDQAEVLATRFPGADLEVGEPGSDLTVLLGSDYDPDAAPRDDEPEPAPKPSAGPSPEPTYAGATAPEDVEC